MAEFQFIGTFWYSKHCCAEKSGRQLFNMAANSKWLPMSPFWPTAHTSTTSQVKWAEISWGTSFINTKCYFDINLFVSWIQNGDLSKWRPSESGNINQCEPVSWEKGFHSTQMSWIEARDTCLWQWDKSYTLPISSDSIWPLVSLIFPFLSARFKGYFLKEIMEMQRNSLSIVILYDLWTYFPL